MIDVPAVDLNRGEAALVTRPAMHVLTRQIGPGDAALVGAFAAGACLEDAMIAALAVEPAFDLQTALQGHLLDGTFGELS